MNLNFDLSLAHGYTRNSQKIRVMSEAWVAENMFCPCCGNQNIVRYENNRPVADFHCTACGEEFELKSKQGAIHTKIADGAYFTAIQRIESNKNPELLVLQYQDSMVTNLTLIPKYFFTPSVVEKRRPLSQTARRAGWIGCNILYNEIPRQGKIPIIRDGHIIEKSVILAAYNKSKLLYTPDMHSRGWLFDVLQCINTVPGDCFTLADVYQFTDSLARIHPDNHNIQPKIRQQLQILRDKGYLTFLGSGRYQKVNM